MSCLINLSYCRERMWGVEESMCFQGTINREGGITISEVKNECSSGQDEFHTVSRLP